MTKPDHTAALLAERARWEKAVAIQQVTIDVQAQTIKRLEAALVNVAETGLIGWAKKALETA